MSFESGRKLGFTASLISIIVPVIMVIALASYLFSVIASISLGLNRAAPNVGVLSIGFQVPIIALGVVAFVGYVLFMIAMYRLSKYYGEPAIFNNLLYALIIGIVGIVVVVGIFVGFVFSSIGIFVQTTTPSTATPLFAQFIIVYLAVIGVAVALAIVGAVLYMRAFNKLADKSGMDSFRTAGLLYLIGTLLSFIGIGAIIAWIAWIFAAMGFHRLTSTPMATNTYATPQGAPITGVTKRCPYCGIENSQDAIYCGTCGKQL